MWKFVVGGAFLAFLASGPLQHAGVLPKTAVGDLSKQAIKSALGLTATDAHARCGPGGGFRMKGNNGFGNGGFDGVPGRSADNNAPNAGQKREDRVR